MFVSPFRRFLMKMFLCDKPWTSGNFLKCKVFELVEKNFPVGDAKANEHKWP